MFEAVERKIDRQAPAFTRETNDFLLTTKHRKNKDGSFTKVDLLKFSKAKFVETGVIDKFGVLMLRNTDARKVYIATVPEDKAKAFTGRREADKSQEAGYNEIVKQLAEYGFIPEEADRPKGFKAAFDLVAIPEDQLAEAKKASEHIENVYELVPAELIVFNSKSESEDEGDEETAEAAQDSASEAPSEETTVTEESTDESDDDNVTEEY